MSYSVSFGVSDNICLVYLLNMFIKKSSRKFAIFSFSIAKYSADILNSISVSCSTEQVKLLLVFF